MLVTVRIVICPRADLCAPPASIDPFTLMKYASLQLWAAIEARNPHRPRFFPLVCLRLSKRSAQLAGSRSRTLASSSHPVMRTSTSLPLIVGCHVWHAAKLVGLRCAANNHHHFLRFVNTHTLVPLVLLSSLSDHTLHWGFCDSGWPFRNMFQRIQ